MFVCYLDFKYSLFSGSLKLPMPECFVNYIAFLMLYFWIATGLESFYPYLFLYFLFFSSKTVNCFEIQLQYRPSSPLFCNFFYSTFSFSLCSMVLIYSFRLHMSTEPCWWKITKHGHFLQPNILLLLDVADSAAFWDISTSSAQKVVPGFHFPGYWRMGSQKR